MAKRPNAQYSRATCHVAKEGLGMAVSSRIFISYRRDDASAYAGRLYDALSAEFPAQVFMDIDTLEPGIDFVQRIEETVECC